LSIFFFAPDLGSCPGFFFGFQELFLEPAGLRAMGWRAVAGGVHLSSQDLVQGSRLLKHKREAR